MSSRMTIGSRAADAALGRTASRRSSLPDSPSATVHSSLAPRSRRAATALRHRPIRAPGASSRVSPPIRTIPGLDAFTIDSYGASIIVDIPSSAVGFRSHGCGTWDGDPTPLITPGQPFGEGTYLVGAEIAPGRYRSTSSSASCTWFRLPSFSWYTVIRPPSSGSGGGPYTGSDGKTPVLGWIDASGYQSLAAIVDIKAADIGFTSFGCGVWSPLTPLIAPGQPFGDGTYLVGSEVAPGRYRTTSASNSCYWVRLGGFGDRYDGDLPWGSWGWNVTIVDVAPTDVVSIARVFLPVVARVI